MIKIPYFELLDGNKIPVLGIGTWSLRGIECIEVVRRSLELGYCHIDTAEMYKNESEIGKAIENADRSELFIVSKVWPDHLNYEGILRACNASLERLGLDYLDLYLIHWPKVGMNLRDIFKAFIKLKGMGKTKSIGVSNFNQDDLETALLISQEEGLKITVNQIEVNPGNFNGELIDYCREKGIIVVAYSPFDKGRALKLNVVKEISEKYGKTPAQIILRWLLYEGIVVIPKATSYEHLTDNLGVFDFDLNVVDVGRLRNGM